MTTQYAYTLTTTDTDGIGPVYADDHGPFYGVSDAMNAAWNELFSNGHLNDVDLTVAEVDITNTVYQYPIEVEIAGWLVRADMAHSFDG